MKSKDLFKPRKIKERENDLNEQIEKEKEILSKNIKDKGIIDFEIIHLIKEKGIYEVRYNLDKDLQLITSETQEKSGWSTFEIITFPH